MGQRLGVAHADRVECLVLCDTAASMAAPGLWEERIEAARSGGMAAVVDATVERWFTPAGRERLAPQVSEVRDMILATPVEGFAGCCQAIAAMGPARGHSRDHRPHSSHRWRRRPRHASFSRRADFTRT